MGGKGKKKQTVGYKYYINMHFAVCHGTVDALRSIWWADKVYWSGSAGKTGDGSTVTVWPDQSGMFGGEMAEGGAEGIFEFGAGSYDQTMIGVNPDGTYNPAAVAGIYPKSTNQNITARHPVVPAMAVNYRGLCVVMLHDNYVGNNAYLKDISFEVERYWDGWFPETRRIGDNMNPAHIIYECLINEDWGLGYPRESINDAAFRAAANTLSAESFGLSFVWDSGQDIEAFIEDVKSCIDASFYLDRRTGLWTLQLIRPGDSPTLTVSPVNSQLESFARRALGETFNELSVKWTNPQSEEVQTLTVQDVANIEAQGRAVQSSKEYVGVRDEGLAGRIAQRDLQVASATLATAVVVVNRVAWALAPGSVVSLAWPPLGIQNLQMRVTESVESAPGSDDIRLTLTEDLFGQANSDFSGVNPPGWVDEATPPDLFDVIIPWEIPFWYVVANGGVQTDQLPQLAAYGTTLVTDPNPSARSASLYALTVVPSGVDWVLDAIGPLTPSVKTLTAMGLEVVSAVDPDLTTSIRLMNIEQDSFALLTDGTHQELVQIVAQDDDGTMTMNRGVMDTQPRLWPASTRIMFIGESQFIQDYTQWSMGSTVSYRPAMQTSIGLMDVEAIPTVSLDTRGRYELPYPVANVTIGGSWWPDVVTVSTGTLRVDWSSRNRMLQDIPIQVKWDAASIAPEEGTTFGATLLNGSGATLVSVTGITATGVDIPLSGISSGAVKLVVWAERGGRRNYIDFEHTFTLTVVAPANGYGKSYGQSYGLA